MDYTYKFELNFDDGAGWLTIDNDYIITDSIKRKLCFHNNLEPNSNSLQFQMRRDSIVGSKTLSNYLLTSDTDIQIRVTRTESGTVNYLPYFAGYLSDNYKLIVNHSGIELIDMKSEDGTNKLLKRKYPRNLNLLSKKICDTSNYADSVLKLAFGTGSDASYVPFNLASLPDIDNVAAVSLFSNYEDKTTYDYLKSVLYEYGYTFLFNESGEVVVKSYKPVSTTPTTGFYNKQGSRNIYGKVEINKNRVQYKEVTVNFQTLKTLSNVIVFTDTTGGDSINKCNIEILAGNYYPEGASENDEDGIIYSDYKLETGETIISVNGITLDVEKDSQISLLDNTNLYKRCKLKYVNDGASTYNITQLDILGTSVVAEDVFNKVTKGTNVGDKYLKYDANNIHTKAEAEFLAQTLVDYYSYANIKYTLQSDAVFAVGDFVKIEEDAFSGINTMAQIMEVEDYAGTDIKKYTLIGAGTLSVTTVGDSSWLNSSPTINNYDPQQEVTTQDVIDAVANSDVVALQRAAYFSEGKGIIIPLDVYPEGGIAEPSYAMVKQLANQFPTISTYVILDPDPVQPYSSTELFYGMASGNVQAYIHDANYIKWQFYLDAISELRKAGVKVLLKASSVADIDNLIRWFKEGTLVNFDGVVIPDLFYPFINEPTYYENNKTTLKTITDYAHLKGYYPVMALGGPNQKFLTDKAIDVSILEEAGQTVAAAETLSLTYTNNLYRAYLEEFSIDSSYFDSARFKELFEYYNLIYSQNYGYYGQITNGGRKYKAGIATKANVVMKLTGGRAPYNAGVYYQPPIGLWYLYSQSFQGQSQMTCDLTVTPQPVTSYWGKLSPDTETLYKLMSGSTSWQDIIDSAAAAIPRTPTIFVTEFVSTAELSWEYQSDLGPALKYYEILVSKDHDPEDSDPDNGTWWKPRNDGIDWWFEDDDEPLQLTNEFYTYQAPLELDEDDNSIETTYFFKVRRVSTSNSGWGYSSATLRPLDSVQIGKDTILAPHIMAGAITADKIAANTITAAHIASVDGGAIRTGNIQSESYSPNAAGWKLALSGSAEFNDVVVRGTVYATDGTFSGSINSGPLMLNKNPPSTTSTTITSGNSVVTWVRALQSAASINSGSYNCSGTYNSTALGRLELAVTSESVVYEQWQKTGTHTVTSTTWNPWATYIAPTMWTDSFGFVHFTAGYWQGAYVTSTVTVEDDVLWRRTETKTTYILKLYSSSNASLLSTTDWYETGSSWTNTGTTGENKSASTSAPTAASATQGTVTFGASGSVSFTANAFTYRLLNLPTADTGLPTGTVYQDSSGYLRIKL